MSIFKSVMSHVWISFIKSCISNVAICRGQEVQKEGNAWHWDVKDRQEHMPSIRAQPTKPSLHSGTSTVLLESQMPIPRAKEETDASEGPNKGLTARPPPPCPGLVSFHAVAMETLCQKTHHLQSVRQAACAPQPCETPRMPFETDVLYLCSVWRRVRGRGGFWLLICGSAD